MADRLFRSRRNRVIGGVSAGLGDYLNLDPVLIRILFVLATIFHGIGILLYIILWIVVPENEYEQPDMKVKSETAGGESSSEYKTEETTGETTIDSEKEQPGKNETIQENKKVGKGRFAAGVILILFGLILLADTFLPYFTFDLLFPFLLIGIGIVLLWNSSRK